MKAGENQGEYCKISVRLFGGKREVVSGFDFHIPKYTDPENFIQLINDYHFRQCSPLLSCGASLVDFIVSDSFILVPFTLEAYTENHWTLSQSLGNTLVSITFLTL